MSSGHGQKPSKLPMRQQKRSLTFKPRHPAVPSSSFSSSSPPPLSSATTTKPTSEKIAPTSSSSTISSRSNADLSTSKTFTSLLTSFASYKDLNCSSISVQLQPPSPTSSTSPSPSPSLQIYLSSHPTLTTTSLVKLSSSRIYKPISWTIPPSAPSSTARSPSTSNSPLIHTSTTLPSKSGLFAVTNTSNHHITVTIHSPSTSTMRSISIPLSQSQNKSLTASSASFKLQSNSLFLNSSTLLQCCSNSEIMNQFDLKSKDTWVLGRPARRHNTATATATTTSTSTTSDSHAPSPPPSSSGVCSFSNLSHSEKLADYVYIVSNAGEIKVLSLKASKVVTSSKSNLKSPSPHKLEAYSRSVATSFPGLGVFENFDESNMVVLLMTSLKGVEVWLHKISSSPSSPPSHSLSLICEIPVVSRHQSTSTILQSKLFHEQTSNRTLLSCVLSGFALDDSSPPPSPSHSLGGAELKIYHLDHEEAAIISHLNLGANSIDSSLIASCLDPTFASADAGDKDGDELPSISSSSSSASALFAIGLPVISCDSIIVALSSESESESESELETMSERNPQHETKQNIHVLTLSTTSVLMHYIVPYQYFCAAPTADTKAAGTTSSGVVEEGTNKTIKWVKSPKSELNQINLIDDDTSIFRSKTYVTKNEVNRNTHINTTTNTSASDQSSSSNSSTSSAVRPSAKSTLDLREIMNKDQTFSPYPFITNNRGGWLNSGQREPLGPPPSSLQVPLQAQSQSQKPFPRTNSNSSLASTGAGNQDLQLSTIAKGVEGAMMQFQLSMDGSSQSQPSLDLDQASDSSAIPYITTSNSGESTTSAAAAALTTTTIYGTPPMSDPNSSINSLHQVIQDDPNDPNMIHPTPSTLIKTNLAYRRAASRLPCPGLCFAVFAKGYGGGDSNGGMSFVMVNNGSVGKVWGWYLGEKEKKKTISGQLLDGDGGGVEKKVTDFEHFIVDSDSGSDEDIDQNVFKKKDNTLGHGRLRSFDQVPNLSPSMLSSASASASASVAEVPGVSLSLTSASAGDEVLLRRMKIFPRSFLDLIEAKDAASLAQWGADDRNGDHTDDGSDSDSKSEVEDDSEDDDSSMFGSTSSSGDSRSGSGSGSDDGDGDDDGSDNESNDDVPVSIAPVATTATATTTTTPAITNAIVSPTKQPAASKENEPADMYSSYFASDNLLPISLPSDSPERSSTSTSLKDKDKDNGGKKTRTNLAATGRSTLFELIGGPVSEPLAPCVIASCQFEHLVMGGQCVEIAEEMKLGIWWRGAEEDPSNPNEAQSSYASTSSSLVNKTKLSISRSEIDKGIADLCKHNGNICLKHNQTDKAAVWSLLELMVTNSPPSSSSSSSSGRLATDDDEYDGWGKVGQDALGKNLVAKLLRYYESVGDFQMLTTMVCVLSGGRDRRLISSLASTQTNANADSNAKVNGNATIFYTFLPNEIGNVQFDRYMYNYCSILYSWNSLTLRTEVMKHISKSSPGGGGELVTTYEKPNTVPTKTAPGKKSRAEVIYIANAGVVPGLTIGSICPRCGVSIANDSNVCPNCHDFAFRCGICTVPVKGASFFCLACGHGGCLNHMVEWFTNGLQSKSGVTTCPSGCGCDCLNSQTTGSSVEDDEGIEVGGDLASGADAVNTAGLIDHAKQQQFTRRYHLSLMQQQQTHMLMMQQGGGDLVFGAYYQPKQTQTTASTATGGGGGNSDSRNNSGSGNSSSVSGGGNVSAGGGSDSSSVVTPELSSSKSKSISNSMPPLRFMRSTANKSSKGEKRAGWGSGY